MLQMRMHHRIWKWLEHDSKGSARETVALKPAIE